MKFYCDEMLARLGRWLRAAGYDTGIAAEGMSDREILAVAMEEDRCLLTRDTRMAELRGAEGGVELIFGNDIEAQARELSNRFAIDWLHAPFSRCLVCNGVLEQAEACLWSRVPSFSRADADRLDYCPACDRVYWHGGHVKRMRRKLEAWRRAHAPS